MFVNPRSLISSPMIINFLACVFFINAATAATAHVTPAVTQDLNKANSKERSRLEELFIWKTSEELKLPPAIELKFTDVIRELSQRRRDANAKLDAALSKLNDAKTKPEFEKAIAAHRAALRETQAVQNAELDRLKPLLGPEKLAKYILVKNSILEKMKSILASPQTIESPAPGASGGAAGSSGAAAGSPDAVKPVK